MGKILGASVQNKPLSLFSATAMAQCQPPSLGTTHAAYALATLHQNWDTWYLSKFFVRLLRHGMKRINHESMYMLLLFIKNNP